MVYIYCALITNDSIAVSLSHYTSYKTDVNLDFCIKFRIIIANGKNADIGYFVVTQKVTIIVIGAV